MAWTLVFSSRSTRRIRYHQNFFLRVATRLVLSVVLGCAAIECLYIADKLKPYSALRDRVTEVLTFPGFVIAHLVQLVGIQTGGTGDESWWLFFVVNSFFYAVVCYFVLGVLHLPRSSANLDGSNPPEAAEPLSLKLRRLRARKQKGWPRFPEEPPQGPSCAATL